MFTCSVISLIHIVIIRRDIVTIRHQCFYWRIVAFGDNVKLKHSNFGTDFIESADNLRIKKINLEDRQVKIN